MPYSRKKNDLCTFRHTLMYKEIKAFCGHAPSSKRPNEKWTLIYGLINRENGLTGSFNSNQQRRIANLYIPNKKISRLMSLNSKICICKFNLDGSRLITASGDGIARIYDSSKGTYHLVNRIKLHDYHQGPLDIDFSPCGRYFGYSAYSKCFFVVPINDTSYNWQWYEMNMSRFSSFTYSLRFSPDDNGRTMVGSSSNSTIFVCDRSTRSLRTICTNRHLPINIHAISYISDKDSNLLVSGCNDGLIKLWDLRCYTSDCRISKPVSVFLGHLDGITYIDPRNDGKYILSNSCDQSIKLWDLRRPTPWYKVPIFHKTPIKYWDYRRSNVPREYSNPISLDGDVSIMSYRGHRVAKSLLRAKFSPIIQTGQRYIYTGCSTGRIIIYDVLTGDIKETIEGHRKVVADLDWHPERSEIISGSWDRHINLNSYGSRRLIRSLNQQNEINVHPERRSRRLATRSGLLIDEYSSNDNDDN